MTQYGPYSQRLYRQCKMYKYEKLLTTTFEDIDLGGIEGGGDCELFAAFTFIFLYVFNGPTSSFTTIYPCQTKYEIFPTNCRHIQYNSRVIFRCGIPAGNYSKSGAYACGTDSPWNPLSYSRKYFQILPL
jgi:hypothetical protein